MRTSPGSMVSRGSARRGTRGRNRPRGRQPRGRQGHGDDACPAAQVEHVRALVAGERGDRGQVVGLVLVVEARRTGSSTAVRPTQKSLDDVHGRRRALVAISATDARSAPPTPARDRSRPECQSRERAHRRTDREVRQPTSRRRDLQCVPGCSGAAWTTAPPTRSSPVHSRPVDRPVKTDRCRASRCLGHRGGKNRIGCRRRCHSQAGPAASRKSLKSSG